MTYSFRVDSDPGRKAPPSWTRQLIQARADDVVLEAARFKPNAAGSHELTFGEGFEHRQILKARGVYLGERLILGVTPISVHAFAVFFGGRASREVACWPRVEIAAELISPRGGADNDHWPAAAPD